MRTKESSPANAKQVDPMNDYETKNHLDTLMQAEMIKADPVKMAKVHKLAGRHMKALSGIKAPPEIKAPRITSIKQLKGALNQKFGPSGDNDGDE